MASPNTLPNTFSRCMTAAVVLLVVLAGALAMSPSVADPDLWGHVQFGRDVLNTGEIAPTTSYSYSAEGFRWINHENLSEIVLAWVVDNYGNFGLSLGKFLLAIFVIGSVMVFNLRQKVGLVPTSIIALLVAWNLGYHWSFRPQVSSFIIFTLMILVLQFCFTGWRDEWHLHFKRWFGGQLADEANRSIGQSWFQGRMLWLLFPIVVIWTNSHGGFVAGTCIAVAYLILRAFEAWVVKGPNGFGYVRRMSLIALAIVVATLLNPYSYRLPMWLIESLGSPRIEITDWSNGQLATLVGMKFWCLIAVAGFAVVLTRKSHDFVQLAILGITLWQALSHFRHVPFFTLLCGFWLGPHLQSALNRVQQRADSIQSSLVVTGYKRQLAVACTLLLLIAGVGFQINGRLSQIKVDRSVYPVDALAFLNEHQINGKVVVTYNWAQYTIAAMCVPETDTTKSKLAFDGRFRTCYPQEVVDMHFDFLYGNEHLTKRYRSDASGQIDPFAVLEFGNPDLAIVRRQGEIAADVLRQASDRWTMLYQDGLAEVWGLKSRFDDPNGEDYLSVDQRKISAKMPRGNVSWPAIRSRNRSEVAEMDESSIAFVQEYTFE